MHKPRHPVSCVVNHFPFNSLHLIISELSNRWNPICLRVCLERDDEQLGQSREPVVPFLSRFSFSLPLEQQQVWSPWSDPSQRSRNSPSFVTLWHPPSRDLLDSVPSPKEERENTAPKDRSLIVSRGNCLLKPRKATRQLPLQNGKKRNQVGWIISSMRNFSLLFSKEGELIVV